MATELDVEIDEVPITSANAPSADAVSTDAAPPEPTAPTAAATAEILAFLLTHSQPADLPRRWVFLGRSPAVRQLIVDEHELATQLQENFSLPDLTAARVLRCSADGETHISAVLSKGKKFLVGFDENKRPIDIINARGLLSFADPPRSLSALAGCAPGKRENIVLAQSDHDLHVLHRLGFACAPAGILQWRLGSQVEKFFGPDSGTAKQRKEPLILPLCQLADIKYEPSRFAVQILEHICRADHLYAGARSREITVWSPDAKDFMQFWNAVQLRDADLVSRILSRSFEQSVSNPEKALQKHLDEADADLPTARAELRHAIHLGEKYGFREHAAVAIARMRRTFRSSILDKMDAEAAAASNLREALLWLQAREIAEHWFETQEDLIVGEQLANGHQAKRRGIMDGSVLAERMKLMDKLTVTIRELLRHK